jgi:hypothetical protein
MSKIEDASIQSLLSRIELRINFLLVKLKEVALKSSNKTLTEVKRDVFYRKAVKIMKELEPFKVEILEKRPDTKIIFDAVKFTEVQFVNKLKINEKK